MSGRIQQDTVHRALAAAIAAFGVLALGSSWPLSADQLVYSQQAAALELSTRTAHLGWILLLVVGGNSGAWLLQALSAAVVVGGAAGLRGRAVRGWTAWVALAAVLPIAGVLEVDLLCTALIVLSAVDRSAVRCTLWLALALLVSPLALLVLPWLWLRDPSEQTRTVLLSALGLWLGLVTVVGGMDWLTGERGLLTAPSWRLRTVLSAWVERLPWLVLGGLLLGMRQRPPRSWIGVLPLFVAPADVPVQLLATVMLLGEGPAEGRPSRALGVLVVLQLVVTAVTTHEDWQQAQQRHQVLQRVAEQWQPGDVVLAPWSVGVELSTLVSGTAYGVPWRSERTLLDRQRAQWCSTAAKQVYRWQHGDLQRYAPSDPQVRLWLDCASAPAP